MISFEIKAKQFFFQRCGTIKPVPYFLNLKQLLIGRAIYNCAQQLFYKGVKMDDRSSLDASTSKIRVPDLTDEEKQGMRDYWTVYESHREKISANLLKMASEHPEFKYILRNAASQPNPEEQARNQEIQRSAIFDENWVPYLENLQ